MERKRPLSRKEALEMAGLTLVVLSGCDRVISSFQATPTIEKTPTPTFKPTDTQTETATPKATNILEATNTPTATATPEVFNWNYVSTHTDEEIFNGIGIPNHEDYGLEEELSADKILRNEEGQSYALFKNEAGIDLLAKNLETKTVEHAVYAEFEGGEPLLLLTDPKVVEHDGGWFQLDEKYGQAEARDRLAHAFNRALAMRWWGVNHRNVSPDLFGVKDWLGEIPGFYPTEFLNLSKLERREISDYIMQEFLEVRDEAETNNLTLPVELADKNSTIFDAANETLIIKAVLSESPGFKPIFEHYGDSRHSFITTEKNGTFQSLLFSQPSFHPYREPRSLGGTITHFFRYFFGARYFYNFSDTDFHRSEYDMTGPILEDLCKRESIPEKVLNFYKNTYSALDDYIAWQTPTNTCSVVFDK